MGNSPDLLENWKGYRMNPDLVVLARLRTMQALHNFVGSDMEPADWDRLNELEWEYGEIRTRMMLETISDPTL